MCGIWYPIQCFNDIPDTIKFKNGGSGNWAEGVTSQAEPNGIYTNGLSTSATWILALNDEGDISPVYVEQEICVRQKDNKIDKNKCEDWSLTKDY